MEFNSNEFLNESYKDPRVTRALESYYGKKEEKEDRGTDKFLNDLYSYPPKFSVYRTDRDAIEKNLNDDAIDTIGSDNKAIEKKDSSETATLEPSFFPAYKNLESDEILYRKVFPSKGGLSAKPVYKDLGRGNEAVPPPTPISSSDPILTDFPKKMPRELDRYILDISSYSKFDYLKGFLDKTSTSNFFANVTKPLKKVLETSPVYVILNGQDKIVLAHETTLGSPKVPNNKLYVICGAFADNGTLKNGKLGLAFFAYNDAKAFMDAIVDLEPDETRIVGLAIHCVSLGSVYELMRSTHPGTDFRLIPDTTNLVSSYTVVEDSRFLFQEELYDKSKERYVNEYDVRDLSDLNDSPLQNLTKGVPVYLVQLQENKRGIAKSALRSIVNKADRFTAIFARPHKLGRKTMKGPLPEKPATTAHLFFDYRKALDFCKENNRFVVPFSGSYSNPRFDDFVQKPIVFVTNLDTLLEYWENDLIEVSGNKNLVVRNTEMRELWHTMELVPIRDSEKPCDAEKSKLLNSPIRKMCREIKVRYRILNSFLEYIWIA